MKLASCEVWRDRTVPTRLSLSATSCKFEGPHDHPESRRTPRAHRHCYIHCHGLLQRKNTDEGPLREQRHGTESWRAVSVEHLCPFPAVLTVLLSQYRCVTHSECRQGRPLRLGVWSLYWGSRVSMADSTHGQPLPQPLWRSSWYCVTASSCPCHTING